MEEAFFPFEESIASGIYFHSEDIKFSLTNTQLLENWFKKIIEQEEKELSLLNFIFCSDQFLHKINLEYLDHDTYTDIITFPMASLPKIEGEIYISIDRIKENAKSLKTTFEEELHRVLIHGVLHLCGYLDKTEAESGLMRQKENEALQKLNELKKT